jgi:predicted NUDIX family NTP pyrophosphohydrolase
MVRILALTLWVVLVHPNGTFFVARNDGQLLVGKEKVGGGDADLVGILR